MRLHDLVVRGPAVLQLLGPQECQGLGRTWRSSSSAALSYSSPLASRNSRFACGARADASAVRYCLRPESEIDISPIQIESHEARRMPCILGCITEHYICKASLHDEDEEVAHRGDHGCVRV